jgi:hypothetical protein
MANTTIAAAARRAALAAVFGATAAATVLGFAGTASAAPATSTPNILPPGMYGNPTAAAPYWAQQHTGDDCGLMAVADVVGQITHHEPTEQQIISVAENTPSARNKGSMVYQPGAGTWTEDQPVLLAHYGIHAAASGNSNLQSLELALVEGKKVIALVNDNTIWSPIRYSDGSGNRTTANHSVVVTGIDTKAGVVHLNDSGIDKGKNEQISIAIFQAAWATGHNWATVTS